MRNKKSLLVPVLFFFLVSNLFPNTVKYVPQENKQIPYWQLAGADLLLPGFGALYQDRPYWAAFYATAKLGSIYLAYSALNNYSYWNSLNNAAQSRQATESAPLRFLAADGKGYTATQIFNKKNETVVQISIASILLSIAYGTSLLHTYFWHREAELDADGFYHVNINQEGNQTMLSLSYYY